MGTKSFVMAPKGHKHAIKHVHGYLGVSWASAWMCGARVPEGQGEFVLAQGVREGGVMKEWR